MTYLDPEATRTTVNWQQWATWLATAAAIIAIGWFAFVAGTEDGTVQPQVVPEPVLSDPATPAM